jgi:hypothetical protein
MEEPDRLLETEAIMDYPPKYCSTPHWPWSETVHRDDTVHIDPEGFVGHEVVITEKLDGGNTCLWNGEVYARSTSQPSRAGWMAMVRKHHAWKTVGADPSLVLYGEDLYGIHSIEYEPMLEDQTYRLFAAREMSATQDRFLEWDFVEAEAAVLQVPTVPVLFRGVFDSTKSITEWFVKNLRDPSSIGGPREGFVMRHVGAFATSEFSQKVAKYVRAHHVQTDQHWTKNWQPAKMITGGST